jgi:hypothetical protein
MTEQEHGAQRVSHEDRDQVAEALRVAAGDGRLTADELDGRLERALTARTYDDLAPLLADLPGAGAALAAMTRAPLPRRPQKTWSRSAAAAARASGPGGGRSRPGLTCGRTPGRSSWTSPRQ